MVIDDLLTEEFGEYVEGGEKNVERDDDDADEVDECRVAENCTC